MSPSSVCMLLYVDFVYSSLHPENIKMTARNSVYSLPSYTGIPLKHWWFGSRRLQETKILIRQFRPSFSGLPVPIQTLNHASSVKFPT